MNGLQPGPAACTGAGSTARASLRAHSCEALLLVGKHAFCAACFLEWRTVHEGACSSGDGLVGLRVPASGLESRERGHATVQILAD